MHTLLIAAILVLTLHHWYNDTLLHGRWALEAVIVDTADKLSFEIHAVERIDSFIIVGFNLSCEWRRVSS